MRRFSRVGATGFTLVELLVAVSIVMVLLTLSIGVQRYASDKSMRSKAEVEIRAISTACENFKTDQGAYPRTAATDKISSVTPVPEDYIQAGLDLYVLLSGDSNMNGKPDVSEGVLAEGKSQADPVYMEFKPSQLRKSAETVRYIRDPWDAETVPKPYGYSTRRAMTPDDPTSGYNSTFDLWTTANKPANPKAWISNW